jgi:AraC family transcriptional regulator, exoenzyme S synthesis regulatory protein ExsA
MNNTYDFKVARTDIIKQLTVKDILIAYYKCPQVDKVLHVFTHYN